MNDSFTLAPSTYPGKPGLWRWLLRATGLEAWFRRAPATAHAGQEKHILLLLTLAGTTRATRSAHAALLAAAARECAATISTSGGALISYQPGTLLLAWPSPAEQSAAPVAAVYFQLRACVRRLAGVSARNLGGAAGLGWATPSPAQAAPRYDARSLRALAGLLHESQQLGGDLLLTAALHQQLAPAAGSPCQLHVAFEVPGHRYPATLYRVATPATD